MKEYENAIDDFNMAILLNPGNYSFFIKRGFTKLELNELNSALLDFNEDLLKEINQVID